MDKCLVRTCIACPASTAGTTSSRMDRLRYISKVVLLLLFVFLWGAEVSLGDSTKVEMDAGSHGVPNQNYFFYKQSEYPRDCSEVLSGCSPFNASGVHIIKPDGYPEPFEVYCKNDDVSMIAWTIIQRRAGGHVVFDRPWQDFRDGFGFLSNDFWLGNEKLSYLTNQGPYELRVDLRLSDGSSFYVTYNHFRISDEWGEYQLVILGDYHSYGDGAVTPCPRNMVYGNCTCQGTCAEPNGSSACPGDCELGNEGCICPAGFLMDGDRCVPFNECPCFWSEVNQVIPNGQFHVNEDCTERRSCTNNVLTQGDEYQCHADARCVVQDGVRQCYCNAGFEGDGQDCEAPYTDCYDAYNAGHRQDGVYRIKPTGWPGSAFNVTCVMSTNGGGWTVFLRRTGVDRGTNFYRNWVNYRDGFGYSSGDFWLGNEKLHYLTSQRANKLRVDLRRSSNSPKYAEYSSFGIGPEGDKYRLTATGYSGNTGYYGLYDNNGKAFSTYDRDNDACGTHHCAEKHRGGWWYSDNWCSNTYKNYCHCFTMNGATRSLCSQSNLNGEYDGGNGENIYWYSHLCNLNFAEMKIRPSS